MTDPVTARRDYLLAAINDTEGTIRATDTKASIALVLHGLLFAGVVAVVNDLGNVYPRASHPLREAMAGCLAAAALSFAASVGQLLRCIRPAPAGVIPELPNGKMRNTFFLLGEPNAIRGRWNPDRVPGTLLGELTTLTEAEMVQELAGELIKLSAIRGRKTAMITSGIWWLALTFAAVLAFLALVASQVV